MFFKKYGDIFVSIFFGIFSIVMIVLSMMLPKSKVMDIGPEFMPIVIGILMLVLSGILLIQSIRSFKTVSEECKEYKDDSEYKRVILSLLLCIAYVFLLAPLGFIISTLLYLGFQIYVLAPDDKRTKRDVVTYVIIDVIFTVVVFFLFRYGFTIVLPAGIFTISI
jgi:hypothetical protein